VSCWSGSATASPLDAWGGATGGGIVALNQATNVGTTGSVDSSVYLAVGSVDQVDIIAGVGAVFEPGAPVAAGAVELMPRVFVHDSVGIGLYSAWVPGEAQAVLGPQLHLNGTAGPVGLFADLAWSPTVGVAANVGTASVHLAADVRVTSFLSTFIEVHTEGNLVTGDLALSATPGLSFVLDRDGRHEIASGVRLPLNGEWPKLTVGAWYSVAIDLGRRSS